MKFFIDEYKGKYVMHCKTEAEAIDFCKYLHEHGRKWVTGRSYLFGSCYDYYEQDTAYNFNEGTYSPIDFFERNGYTILEWSDFMDKPFTKENLRTGDVILRRDGDVEIVNCELGMFIRRDCLWNDLVAIADDLSSTVMGDCDIIAVRRPKDKGDCTFDAFKMKRGILVYEREEVEEMTLAEVCKLLGKNIKIIK